MAQPATNPKIEELRFKLKTDPKSRLFYQLAEELRKAGHLEEAEHVLGAGLLVYPTYLAAWVSLGRVMRDKKNDGAAVEALTKALQLDPGNVVAARLLADAYLALGEKVEAIKKYKLVLALLPTDEELRNTVAQLDQELHQPVVDPAPVEALPVEALPVETPSAAEDVPAAGETPAEAIDATPVAFEEESPFDKTMPPFAEAESTGDAEPMARAHDESPFEEPVEGFTSATMEIEAASGFQVETPLAAEVPAVFETEEPAAAPAEADVSETITMADLYVRQGLVDEARTIYEHILARDPANADVRAKLDAITPQGNAKVAQLERWLAKVKRSPEVPRV